MCDKSNSSYQQMCNPYNQSGYDRVAKLAPSTALAPNNAFSALQPKVVYAKGGYGSAGYNMSTEQCGHDSGNYLSVGDAYGHPAPPAPPVAARRRR